MNGILGNYNLFNTRFQSVARCSTDRYSSVTLNLCNRSELETCYVDIAVTTTENVIDTNSRYIEYNTRVAPNTSFKRDGILLSQGEFLTLVYRGEDPRCLTATVWGIESGEDQGLAAIAENLDPSPVIVTTSLPNAEEGQPYSQQIVATDNRAVATYGIASGSLPPGLSLDTITGVISGTPDVTGNAQQDFTFTVRVTDIVDEFTDQELTITRTPDTTPPVWITDAVTGLVIDQAFSYQLVADDVGDISYSLDSGTVPTGLIVNNEGLLVGTPTVGGAFTFTVTATNSAGLSANQTFNVNVRAFAATGGTVTDVSIDGTSYRIHAFTDVGEDEFVMSGSGEIDVLVVAGGGGGGSHVPGGGGAGGLIYRPALTASSQSYTITVGDGGAGSFNPGSYGGMPNATRGGDSSFDSLLTALGGGFAGSWTQDTRSNEGGSGGGRNTNRASRTGLQPSQPGDSGTYGFGNDGALCAVPGTSNYPGGGGGGAGEQPPDAPNQNTSGRGGDGMDMSDYFGTLYGENGWFAGGGEGGAWGNVTLTNGGLGGGGDGDCPNSGSNGGSKRRNGSGMPTGFDGMPNTGGGGGGAGRTGGSSSRGGDGGSGIVLVRYEL